MTTTVMHFGPEWMRAKQQPARPAPSPPLTTAPPQPGASSYSALVAPAAQLPLNNPDLARPFRYSKEELLRIYKEGGGRGGLGLEVERWEGIVRELGSEPVGLKEMGEAEKKIFSGSLNSEIRRRQSTDYLSTSTSTPGDRSKLGHASTAAGSPMRDRMGNFSGRRRDSTDQLPLTLPRKQSLSSIQGSLPSPREAPLPSPRVRIGHSSAFDGVLDGSWTAKRRASEGVPKPATSQNPPAEAGIKEEEEEQRLEPQLVREQNGFSASPPPDPVFRGSNKPTGDGSGVAAAENIRRNDSVQNGASVLTGRPTPDPITSGPPPGLVDLASVEWSYLDPQGQVQGPFRADVMQKWYDEGYFIPDLLMKRTHVDSDWMPVKDLLRLAGSLQLFLVPLNPHQPDTSTLQPPDQDPTKNQFGSSYEPIPRPLHGSPLGYLHNGSSRTDSPTSSFSTGRFGTNSPDTSGLGGVQTEVAIGGFSAAVETQRHPTMEEYAGATLSSQSSFVNHLPAQPGVLNVTNGRSYPVANGVSLPTNPNTYSPAFGAGIPTQAPNFQGVGPSVLRGVHDGGPPNGQLHFGSNDIRPAGPFIGQSEQPHLANRDAFNRSPYETRQDTQVPRQFVNGVGPHFQPQSFTQSPALSFAASQDARSTHSLSSAPDRRSPNSPQVHHIVQQQPFQSVPTPSVTQSPWGTPEVPTPRRPGPFDPDFPTSQNVVATPICPPPQPVYVAPPVQTPVPTNQSPWFVASTGVVSDGWANTPASLTVANLGQHNQQQELLRSHTATDSSAVPKPAEPNLVISSNLTQEPVSIAVPSALPSVPQPASAPAPVSAPTQEPSRPPKVRRKSSTLHTGNATPVKGGAPPVPAAKPSSPTLPSNDNKVAWGIDEDHKTTSSPPVLGLREIQAAEAKKADIRKAAERERAARLAAASSPSSEEVQPFSASWGLPTSQAGAARAHTLPKDAGTSPAATTVHPVWTHPHKPQVVKKSMKEIQEEEERRNKQAAEKKETVAAAARRAYVETAVKPTVPAAGGAWTTVGAGGKTSAAAAAVAVARPAPPSVATAAKIVASTSGPSHSIATTPLPTRTLSSGPLPRPPVVAASSVKASKVDESPVPSQDFGRWLSESLRGLNSSVNFEEITSMLLSFPIDPDQSTIEIISELIYANSTTLDGRRFAAEFVSRRKASVKASSPSGIPGKPLSIADVVKSQPKPAQNEWGGFKVVNKKKKGSRA